MRSMVNRLKCSAAVVVLAHATDLSPVWLIESYRQWVSGLLLANKFTVALFLVAVFAAYVTLIGCLSRHEAAAQGQ